MKQRPFSDHSFNLFLNEEKLMGCRCKACGARFVPPRPLCIKCFKSDMEWMEMSGKGELVAFTCIAIAPPSMMAQGYDRKHPYCLGVVELEGKGRVDARIEGVDPNQPQGIWVGMPVRARFLHRRDTKEPETYLAFERA